MEKSDLDQSLNFLFKYKEALLEKVVDKITEVSGDDDEMQYSLGNFALEDFMDNISMRLAHLNVMLMELQQMSEEQNMRYERLSTKVHTLTQKGFASKVQKVMQSIPPTDLKWVHLEKISPEEYYLIVIKREDV